ncbi:hypothetical protein A2U01_0094343, partial [Trifolium medium]|nr:hypothetical protein [Trifolium medium]
MLCTVTRGMCINNPAEQQIQTQKSQTNTS